MAALRVNEVAVNLYSPREAANWWALFRAHGPATRFTAITAAIPGDLVSVAREGIEDAEWLRDFLIGHGAPHAALKVVRG